MKLAYLRYFIWFLLVSTLTFNSGISAAETKDIYLSPSGNDHNDGLTAMNSLASLQRALDVSSGLSSTNSATVRILVGEGSYLGQTGVTGGLPNGGALHIEALEANKSPATFNGNGTSETWLRINNSRGAPSRIRVYGLEIVNFETAISFNGNRDNIKMWNGENIISDNIFMNIGQISQKSAKPSTAAIRLINSRGNLIFHNKFINIRNISRCSLLHAIYVAHNSTDNIIEQNFFDGGCGDAIRFRDASHRNAIKSNTFRDAWDRAPISDWYCDAENRNDCTKSSGECPSFNNVVDFSKIVTRNANVVPNILTYGPDISNRCPNRLQSDTRFIVGNNNSLFQEK